MEQNKTEGEQIYSLTTVFVNRVPKIDVGLINNANRTGTIQLTEFAEFGSLTLHLRNSEQCRAFITAFAKLAMMLEEAENDAK